MSRVVWLNSGLVDPATASVGIDDPGVRYGEGMRETMRGQDGAVAWLERHLDRLTDSVAALGLTGMPSRAAVGDAVAAVATALGPGTSRITVIATSGPTLLVDGAHTPLEADPAITAISLPATWFPTRRMAEHKTLSFLGWRDALRQAHAAGVDTALLLDDAGRLGEAATANVFCVIGGEIVTPPPRGILRGVTRDVVMELTPVREAMLEEREWRQADEIFVTSAVRGVVPVIRCDDRGIAIGPVTTDIRTRVEARFGC